MPTTARTHTASRVRHTGLLLAVGILAMFTPVSNARAATTLTFNTVPALGTLSGFTLDGQTQTTTTSTTLNNFAVTSSGANAGWNMTVASVAGGGKSSVFKQYCPPVSAPCGADGAGYVAGGYTLPADSLTLDTAGATIGGAAGTKPTFQCSVSPFCNVDTTTPSKVLSAAATVSLAKWTAAGTSTLSLSTPASLHKLQTNEVYRINLVWTLNSGP